MEFKIGDVIRHRLTGELAVVAWTDGDDVTVERGFGVALDYLCSTAVDVIGHISDKRWDAPPPATAAATPDHTLPRRFRWEKYRDSCGTGCYFPAGKLYVFDDGRNVIERLFVGPSERTITEWIDPKPEGV